MDKVSIESFGRTSEVGSLSPVPPDFKEFHFEVFCPLPNQIQEVSSKGRIVGLRRSMKDGALLVIPMERFGHGLSCEEDEELCVAPSKGKKNYQMMSKECVGKYMKKDGGY